MRRILVVAKRDYLATIRTKAFIIGLVVAPLLFGGGFLGLDNGSSLLTSERFPSCAVLAGEPREPRTASSSKLARYITNELVIKHTMNTVNAVNAIVISSRRAKRSLPILQHGGAKTRRAVGQTDKCL